MRVIDLLLRDSAFAIESLTAIKQLLLRVHCIFRRPDLKLRLLQIFRNRTPRSRLIIGFRLLERRLVFRGSAGKVPVFHFGKKLPRANARPAFHIKLLHGSRNLRHDRSLLQRIKERVGGNLERNLRTQHRRHIDCNNMLGFFGFVLFEGTTGDEDTYQY